MTNRLVAGIETGGTKILARLCDLDGEQVVAEGRWETGSAERAGHDLLGFLMPHRDDIAGVGMAAFGPLIVDPSSSDVGQMQATSKPGWTGSNLRAALAKELGVPVAVDSDVNAAAIAEQALGAGQGLPSVAYVTVGTGIGAGLAIRGQSLQGVIHPEAGHLSLIRRPDDAAPSVCPFHQHCAEGLASGPAIRQRLGEGRELAGDGAAQQLVAHYLGQLAAALVMAWSPSRIVWGGGVIVGAPIIPMVEREMRNALGGYGVGPAATEPGFCAAAQLENAGLEGATLMARQLAG